MSVPMTVNIEITSGVPADAFKKAVEAMKRRGDIGSFTIARSSEYGQTPERVSSLQRRLIRLS